METSRPTIEQIIEAVRAQHNIAPITEKTRWDSGRANHASKQATYFLRAVYRYPYKEIIYWMRSDRHRSFYENKWYHNKLQARDDPQFMQDHRAVRITLESMGAKIKDNGVAENPILNAYLHT